jgi:CO dehydrogenase maturation factor
MKIATVGKGGSGKTTIAGTLSRLLAQGDHKVLAIDGDPNPNLALTLGMTREAADAIRYIPSSIMSLVDAGGEKKLVMTVPQDDLIKTYAARAPGGIDLIVMGRPQHGSAGSG